MKKIFIFIFFLLLLLPDGYPVNEVSSPATKTIGQTFDGEELLYDISFFPIPNAAYGRFTFEKNQNGPGYIITLEARTRHLVRLLTLMRKDLYRSYVEEVDGGKRLRSYRFEKEVSYLGKTRRNITFADYSTHKLSWKSWEYGKLIKEGEQDIEPGRLLDDPLVAFYNLRYGVYGTIDFGKTITIDSIPIRNKPAEIIIHIASKETTNKERKRLVIQEERDYYLNVVLAKETFNTKSGKIKIWLSKEQGNGYGPFKPVYGIVEDVIAIGDVSGVLRIKK
ncbi:MAG: DUF3108 domain-containing protein [bacterium]|nr:DUF3108 domain-containing protein [bacterium]